MDDEQGEKLSAQASLALAHTPAELRRTLRIFLELDARIARIVAATTEPILGQMRLAWWRDTLAVPMEQRPRGDAILDGIGDLWLGYEPALVALIDGWEEMLGDTMTKEAAHRFAVGRAKPFDALAMMVHKSGDENVAAAARRWALVDAGIHVSEGAERDAILAVAQAIERKAPLPKPLRGLAVLDALARRSLSRGGRPLMEGRGAALVALKAAIIGR